MPKVDRGDDVHIQYDVRGEGSPLLLTHGYASTSRMWQAQQASLSRARRVISWDMRGHGGSSSPTDPSAYGVQASVDDMAAVLAAAGEQKAVIGGLSLGGYMSLAFWLAHPERVRALVLVDTGPGFKQEAGRERWNKNVLKIAARLEKQGLEYLEGIGDEVSAAEHVSADGLILAARRMLTHEDAHVIHALPEIDVPTLVIVGENDRPYHAASDYMAKKIPDARKVVVPAAGHAVNLHQPDLFERALLDFFEEIGA